MAIHIRRREFIVTLGGAAAAWSLAAHAQQPARSRKVGLLHPTKSTLKGERLGCRRCLWKNIAR